LALKGVGFFLGGGGVSSSSPCIFKHACTLQRAKTIASFLGAACAAACSPPIVLM
jgi:hypothetical protein